MIAYQDLNPEIQKILDIMVDGLDLMESARLKVKAINELEQAALLGVITHQIVVSICAGVLSEDIQRIDRQIADLLSQL